MGPDPALRAPHHCGATGALAPSLVFGFAQSNPRCGRAQAPHERASPLPLRRSLSLPRRLSSLSTRSRSATASEHSPQCACAAGLSQNKTHKCARSYTVPRILFAVRVTIGYLYEGSAHFKRPGETLPRPCVNLSARPQELGCGAPPRVSGPSASFSSPAIHCRVEPPAAPNVVLSRSVWPVQTFFRPPGQRPGDGREGASQADRQTSRGALSRRAQLS